MKTLASYVLAAMLLVLPVAGIFDSSRAAVAPEVGVYLAGINPQTDWSAMARDLHSRHHGAGPRPAFIWQ